MFCVASATVKRGEVVVVLQVPGSQPSFAPSTLEEYQQGRIEIDGIELSRPAILTRFAKKWGWCFSNLICSPPNSSEKCDAGTNLGTTLAKAGRRSRNATVGAGGILEQALKYPGQLSGGQQQRA